MATANHRLLQPSTDVAPKSTLLVGMAAAAAVCVGVLVSMSAAPATTLYANPVLSSTATSRPTLVTGHQTGPSMSTPMARYEAVYPRGATIAAAQQEPMGIETRQGMSPAITLGALALIPAAVMAAVKFFHKKTAQVSAVQDMAAVEDWAMATTVAKPPRELNRMTEEQLEVIKSMDQWAKDTLLPMTLDPSKNWQPQDLLPNAQDEDFEEQVAELRKRSANLPDDYLVVLVGDMITEEALPTYMTMLNTLDGTRDESGADSSPWAQWTRKWTAEENRHGDLLNKYLFLTGRVDMKAIEGTIQRLIGTGMDPKTDNNPYLGFIYTSFQERATKISHGNTARMAKEAGDDQLGKICGLIAADESRHEKAYTRIVAELFRRDPNGTMLAFADMMQKQIAMPAHLMDDGFHAGNNSGRDLFSDFAAVAEKLGVYTAEDYTDILEHLLRTWRIEEFEGLSPEAEKAQQYLLKLPPRFRKLSARMAARKKAVGTSKFSWINNKPIEI